MDENIENKVVELLEEATLAGDESTKVAKLKMAQELIVSHSLLDSYAEMILEFQSGHGNAVRKFVIAFFEIVIRQKPDLFPVITFRIALLLQDTVDDVVKRTIQACTQLYKPLLFWLGSILNVKQEDNIDNKVNSSDDNDGAGRRQQAIECFETWKNIKETVLNTLDASANDGVRTQAVKFIETCILLQTSHDETSANKSDFTIDQLNFPADNIVEIFNLVSLEDEAKRYFQALIDFQSQQHISSTNLTIVMLSLSTIARQRSALFFNQVCDAYYNLCHNFPPTLGANHLGSVKKQLKSNLQKLLKHDYEFSRDIYKKFVDMFTEMGVSRSEIDREMSKKRLPDRNNDNNVGDAASKPKRSKVEEKLLTKELAANFGKIFVPNDAFLAQQMNAEDIQKQVANSDITHVTNDLMKLLSNGKGNISLPDSDPKEFADHSAYYLVINGLGPGFEHFLQHYLGIYQTEFKSSQIEDLEKRLSSYLKYSIHKVLYDYRRKKQKNAGKGDDGRDEAETKSRLKLDDKERELQTRMAFKRIISEKGIPEDVRMQLLICSLKKKTFTREMVFMIHAYVMQDLNVRFIIFDDVLQYFHSVNDIKTYEDLFLMLVDINISVENEEDKMSFLISLFREPACFTPDIMIIFKQTIVKSANITLAEELIKHIRGREEYRTDFMKIYLEISIETSNQALHDFFIVHLTELMEHDDCKTIIEEFSIDYIRMLKFEKPETGIAGVYSAQEWTEPLIQRCLSIYLELLKNNIKYIHELPALFAEFYDDHIRKIVLHSIPKYISSKDIHSEEILKFVQDCPAGSEALVSSVVSFFTENSVPSHELVEKMKERFGSSPNNIRYLIPVLPSFSKTDLIAVLPSLFQLNPIVLKQVFARLLKAYGERQKDAHSKNTISPVDLLIALHNIDISEVDAKNIIKATHMCYDEKEYFTAETVAVTLQQLVTINPLPQLLMRTIIDVVKYYPQLTAFIMNNILPALIKKMIWNQKSLWNGFVRCCVATIPACFAVLAQLPIEQLNDLFESAPDLRPRLQQYIQQSQTEAGFSKRHLDVIFK